MSERAYYVDTDDVTSGGVRGLFTSPGVVLHARGPFSLRSRLEQRAEMNDRTAQQHPDAAVRALAEARAGAYRVALADLDDAVDARKEFLLDVGRSLVPMVYKNLLGIKPVT